MHKDNSGHIWIATKRTVIYRYDGKVFKNYNVPISIMGILEDPKRNICLGGLGGVYRIKQNVEIVNISQNRPWK